MNHLSLPVLPLIMNMTRTLEGNVFQVIIFAMVTMIAKMVQMNNLTYVVSAQILYHRSLNTRIYKIDIQF